MATTQVSNQRIRVNRQVALWLTKINPKTNIETMGALLESVTIPLGQLKQIWRDVRDGKPQKLETFDDYEQVKSKLEALGCTVEVRHLT